MLDFEVESSDMTYFNPRNGKIFLEYDKPSGANKNIIPIVRKNLYGGSYVVSSDIVYDWGIKMAFGQPIKAFFT